MDLTREERISDTKPRTSIIEPDARHSYGSVDSRYRVTFRQSGRSITRTFLKRTKTLSEARKLSREWCA